jgi:hypothetical protein
MCHNWSARGPGFARPFTRVPPARAFLLATPRHATPAEASERACVLSFPPLYSFNHGGTTQLYKLGSLHFSQAIWDYISWVLSTLVKQYMSGPLAFIGIINWPKAQFF